MSLHELNYGQAAAWVLERCSSNTTQRQVTDAFLTLAHAAAQADADCAIEGLFPGSSLEVLLSRDPDRHTFDLPQLPINVEPNAIQAIGEAITHAMTASSTKIFTLYVQDYAEIFVFMPDARETVLLGARTTLLSV